MKPESFFAYWRGFNLASQRYCLSANARSIYLHLLAVADFREAPEIIITQAQLKVFAGIRSTAGLVQAVKELETAELIEKRTMERQQTAFKLSAPIYESTGRARGGAQGGARPKLTVLKNEKKTASPTPPAEERKVEDGEIQRMRDLLGSAVP